MKHIILDTDISNEIDDQFALAYLVNSLDGYVLDAITIAPFSNSGHVATKSLEEANNISFKTACKILDLSNQKELKQKIYLGANKYFYESKQLNSASEKIIEIARKNEKTVIIAIGAITNVAVALYNAPDIIDKLEVIWLGGHSFLIGNNDEYNFKQDIDANRFVFNSGVELTVIHCKNVASHMITTISELECYLKGSKGIGEYLFNIFEYTVKRFLDSPDKIAGASYVLWDISAIAYLLNKDWFEVKRISCPQILDNTEYEFTQGKHEIIFVSYLNRNAIFNDFFIKLNA